MHRGNFMPKALTIRLKKPTLIRGVIALAVLSSLFTVFIERSTKEQQIAAHDRTVDPHGKTADEVNEAYGKVSVYFEANRGQHDARVRYTARTADHALFLTATEAVYVLSEPRSPTQMTPLQADVRQLEKERAIPRRAVALWMRMVGANADSKLAESKELPGKLNYLNNNEWKTDVPTYQGIRMNGVYEGIDVVWQGRSQSEVQYDFIVSPNANSQQIEWEIDGAEEIRLSADGDLIIKTEVGELRQRKPFTYQETDGVRTEIASSYELRSDKRVGFSVGSYDTSKTLTIDPSVNLGSLSYSTLLGSPANENVYAVAVDSSGSVYITGETGSATFPTVAGGFDITHNGNFDAFVSKLNPAGTALVYSTFIGGNDADVGIDITVDSAGSAYVTGSTSSAAFPTTPGAFDTEHNGTLGNDVFITKLNADGSGLVYSTFLGGVNHDLGIGIAVDPAGNAFVTGRTGSLNFPQVLGIYGFFGPFFNGFVTKINAAGSGLIYSTFFGGTGNEFTNGQDGEIGGIAIDSAGNAYVTGSTSSSDFPTTAGAFDNTFGGGEEIFVLKLGFNGTALSVPYATFIGGSGHDYASGIVVDSSGNAYITGTTHTPFAPPAPFPTTAGAFDTTLNGTRDGFVSKLNPAGSTLVYSTLIGGSGNDASLGIALDSTNNALITGHTLSSDFPSTAGAYDPTYNGGEDVFVTKVDKSGSALVASTFIGGGGGEIAKSIAVDSSDGVIITGIASSSTVYPTTPGVLQPLHQGGSVDLFITKFPGADPPPPPTITPTPIITPTPTPTPQTRTVVNNDNSGTGSLRQVILDANAGDTIDFAANVRGTILLTGFEIELNKNLIIKGPGANVLAIETNFAFRVFRAQQGNIKISGLRMSRGRAPNGFLNRGGGIAVIEGANLMLESCAITGNQRGGIYTQSGSTLTINNSQIAGNDGGGIHAEGILRMSNSSVAGNFAGGGISKLDNTMTLTNVTVSGNHGQEFGAISLNSSVVTILNCTIAGNTGDEFIGGLFTGGPSSTVNIKNTIIAYNSYEGNFETSDISGFVNSLGNNLIGNAIGGGGFVASDLLNVDPLLGGFANNGGPTYTHSLLTGSPAINAGNNTGAPATDQRGVARPQDAIADIGSYEFGISSPAFGKIVFVSTQDDNSEIYSMNPNGTSEERLTNNSSDDSAPKWSLDGTRIVFQSRRDGNDEIYIMNADGSGQTRLTFDPGRDAVPDWSPDGNKIVFARGISYPSEIWTMDVSGANQTLLTDGSLFGETEPSWSPDGLRIAFSASPVDGGTWELYVMNADGTNPTRLTNNGETDSYPVWSPDGNSIAYLNDFNGRHAYIISLFDSSIRIVSDEDGPSESAPTWSPDGTKLAQYDMAGNIYIVNVGGDNPPAELGAAVRSPEGIFVSPQLDWFGFNTSDGTNVSTLSGTATVTFSNVSNPGTTIAVPIDPALLEALPSGYSLGPHIPAYEITTTASYSGPITVCLQVPGVTSPSAFNALRILHYVNGTPTDSTILPPNPLAPNFATKTLCAMVDSLSPFVVAEILAPTAANVSIGGRAQTAEGRGIARAMVSITGQNGETRWASTNSFGFYRFDEIHAGETYVISARHKIYRFNSQVLNVSDSIKDADLTAEPLFAPNISRRVDLENKMEKLK